MGPGLVVWQWDQGRNCWGGSSGLQNKGEERKRSGPGGLVRQARCLVVRVAVSLRVIQAQQQDLGQPRATLSGRPDGVWFSEADTQQPRPHRTASWFQIATG